MKIIFQIGIIGLLLFSLVALGKDIYSQYTKFSEIREVENEAQALKNKNVDLKKELEEKNNPFSLEKGARNKLGYQKRGETLYVVDIKDAQTAAEEREKGENWKEWAELFFQVSF